MSVIGGEPDIRSLERASFTNGVVSTAPAPIRNPRGKNRSRPERCSGRGPLLEFNVGSHPGDNTHYVNAEDMLSLPLLRAWPVDLKLPIKTVEGE